VNELVANFIGGEFTLSLIHISPPILRRGDNAPELLKEMPGHVLFRAVIPRDKWIKAVESFQRQIEDLRSQGAFQDQDVWRTTDDADNA
jgi:hypothetical protein